MVTADATLTTNGLEWLIDRAVGEADKTQLVVAVGTGTTAPADDDTSLENEVYRAKDGDEDAAVFNNATDPWLVAEIEVTGGLDVPANTEISELGFFAEDNSNNEVLVYRGIREPVPVENGQTRTLQMRIIFEDLE